ncbi:MAG: hypothetical protein RLZ12_388 [Bacillota bacterium]|jgi:hypothetical protein
MTDLEKTQKLAQLNSLVTPLCITALRPASDLECLLLYFPAIRQWDYNHLAQLLADYRRLTPGAIMGGITDYDVMGIDAALQSHAAYVAKDPVAKNASIQNALMLRSLGHNV